MTLEELNIKITSNAKGATDSIDNIVNTLKALDGFKFDNMSKVVKNLKELSTAMESSGAKNNVSGIKKSITAYSDLKKELNGVSNNANGIKKALNPKNFGALDNDFVARYQGIKDNIKEASEYWNKGFSSKDIAREIAETEERIVGLGGKLKRGYDANAWHKQMESEGEVFSGTGYKLADEEGLKRLKAELLDVGNTGSQAFEKIKASSINTTPQVEQFKSKLMELRSQGKTFGDPEYDNAYRQYAEANSAVNKYKRSLTEAKDETRNTTTETENLNNETKKDKTSGLKAMKSALSGVTKRLSVVTGLSAKFGKGIVKHFNNAISKGIRPLSAGLMRVKNMFKNMLIRSVLYSFMSTVREGFKALAAEDPRFNASMSKMYSSLMTLKNAFVAAFAPILNYVAPVVTKFLDLMTDAITKVTQLFGALFGQNPVTVAKKLNLDYAESMNETADGTDKARKATEKYKKSLMGFDEINKLNAPDERTSTASTGSGGKITDAYQDMFTDAGVNDFAKKLKESWEKADFTWLGETIASKIVNSLKKINWKEVIQKAFNLGKSFATFINGLFSYTDKDGETLATTLGTTVGNAINTLVSYLLGFVENLDTKKIGKELAKYFNRVVKTIKWDKVGKLIGDAIKKLLQGLDKFIKNVNGKKVGEAIGKVIKTIDWGGIIIDVLYVITDSLTLAFDTITGLFDELGKNPKELQGKVTKFVNDFRTWLITAIPPMLKSMVAAIVSVMKNSESIGDAIRDGFWIGVFGDEKMGKDTSAMVKFIGRLINPLTRGVTWTQIWQEVLSNVKPSKAGDSIFGSGAQGAQTVGVGVTASFEEDPQHPQSKLKEKIDKIKSKVTEVKTKFGEWAADQYKKLKGKIDNIKSKTTEIKAKFKEILSKGFQKAVNTWNGLKNKTVEASLKLKAKIDDIKGFVNNHIIYPINLKLYKSKLFSSIQIPYLATGAMGIDRGQMFIANEAGAEMVGQIGHKTAVTNNQQITNALKQAMYEGIMAAGGTNGNGITVNVTVPLDKAVLGRAAIEYHNGRVIQTGRSPLLVGG